MTIEAFNPKFHPNSKVLVYIGGKYNKLVLTTVEYCKFCPVMKEWTYALHGWGTDFKESDLQSFSPHESSYGLTFIY